LIIVIDDRNDRSAEAYQGFCGAFLMKFAEKGIIFLRQQARKILQNA